YILLSIFLYALLDHRALHSFPTRRSSDLHGDMRIGPREAAVVAPAVDRARVANPRTACHGRVFVEGKANHDVWIPAGHRVLRVDKAHRQRPFDVPVLVAHEDCAEL